MTKLFTTILSILLYSSIFIYAQNSNLTYKNTDFVETAQPSISENSKKIIAIYKKNPTSENYQKLKEAITENYNAVLAKKEAKLAELRVETKGKVNSDKIVSEMEEIVNMMIENREEYVNNAMARFTDSRLLKWNTNNAAKFEYVPVMGAGENIYIKRTPVTNSEYQKFILETGKQAPENWKNGKFPEAEADFPVNFVSYEDAQAYCQWLSTQDKKYSYRLPTEEEWELAAGHMPKDAEFNAAMKNSRTSVLEYDGITRGAHGAIDFWGNVWEWTSTARTKTEFAVKGGSYKSKRTDCRTENDEENRNSKKSYEDVGFRIIQVQ